MMNKNKNLLEIDFHDSRVLEINKKENDVKIAIDIDTYWYPGKPVGIIKLIGLKDAEKLVKFWKTESTDPTISFIEIKRRKYKGGKFFLEFEIEFIEFQSKTLKFICENFWLDRLEAYKKYTHTNFS